MRITLIAFIVLSTAMVVSCGEEEPTPPSNIPTPQTTTAPKIDLPQSDVKLPPVPSKPDVQPPSAPTTLGDMDQKLKDAQATAQQWTDELARPRELADKFRAAAEKAGDDELATIASQLDSKIAEAQKMVDKIRQAATDQVAQLEKDLLKIMDEVGLLMSTGNSKLEMLQEMGLVE